MNAYVAVKEFDREIIPINSAHFPSFDKKLHVNKPNLQNSQAFYNYAQSMFSSGWLTNSGPLVQKLESRLSNYLGVDHCVLTCNGTIAMSLVLSALEISGEVILPSFSFISTAHTLTQLGIKPVFCDIDEQGNICPDHCELLITSSTTAIIATHLWGQACDIKKLESLAQINKLSLIFDAAHAFSNTFEGKKIGQFGDAEIFSFHATKCFHTFEGGAVATNNTNLAEQIRKTQNFGFTDLDQVECVGTNAKMPEICAAMGLANLDNLESSDHKSHSNYLTYGRELENVAGIKLLKYDERETRNCHYIVIEVDDRVTNVSRDHILSLLCAENIMARRYFYPGNHRMPPYDKLYPEVDALLPKTNQLCKKILLLPGGSMISEEEIVKVCTLLKSILLPANKS